MRDFGAFLDAFRRDDSFAWSKINHGFWEALGDVEHELGWPVAPEQHALADSIAARPHFFTGGFVDELLALLQDAAASRDPSLTIAFDLAGWPGDNRIVGTPFRPERAAAALARHVWPEAIEADGLLLKQALMDGKLELLIDELRAHHVVVVGPEFLGAFFEATGCDGTLIPIHPTEARRHRGRTEMAIATAIAEADGPVTVLLQAGTLAPYWILRLRHAHPGVRWVDMGLPLSFCAPEDLLWRNWGRIHRAAVVAFCNRYRPGAPLPERDRLDLLRSRQPATAQSEGPERVGPVAFVANEPPDHERVREFLALSEQENRWANDGPLNQLLATAYHGYMGLPDAATLVPCANGGLALEGLARTLSRGAKPRPRWAVSAFTFHNQGRGYFADAEVIDCDRFGMIDLAALDERMDAARIDGVVVTNLFGIWPDFEPYIEFALSRGLAMIIDNAAGIGPNVPNWPYQAFSLHHTKPYGFGEGGLAMMLADDESAFRELMTYGPQDSTHPSEWMANAKLSDAACAYHLDRLERAPEWTARYEMQAIRTTSIARRAGLTPAFDWGPVHAATSLPFVAPRPVPIDRLTNPHLVLGKYYRPLAALPAATRLYDRIVNVPAHPDVAQVCGDALLSVLRELIAP